MSQTIEPRREDESLDAWSRRVSATFVGRQQVDQFQADGGIRSLQSDAQQLGREHDVSFTSESARNPGRPCPSCGHPEPCRVAQFTLRVHRLVFLLEQARRRGS